MNRDRIIEILETYRPGEGMEADPEVRLALQLAEVDPELAGLRSEIESFDASMRDCLRSIPVPADLKGNILAAMRANKVVAFPESAAAAAAHSSNAWARWFHPAAFGAAAAIVILLALTFTFWQRPVPGPAPLEVAGLEPERASVGDISALMDKAHTLYSSLRPTFKSNQGEEILKYLRNRGSVVPTSLPGDVDWDRSFACDVVMIDGVEVSIVCFKAPDNSRTMHLFTFQRSAFPGLQLPGTPEIHDNPGGCCAAWGTEDQVHVLFSDKGEDNLRKVLRI